MPGEPIKSETPIFTGNDLAFIRSHIFIGLDNRSRNSDQQDFYFRPWGSKLNFHIGEGENPRYSSFFAVCYLNHYLKKPQTLSIAPPQLACVCLPQGSHWYPQLHHSLRISWLHEPGVGSIAKLDPPGTPRDSQRLHWLNMGNVDSAFFAKYPTAIFHMKGCNPIFLSILSSVEWIHT